MGTGLVYSSGIVMVPAVISAVTSEGDLPLTVQPMAKHDPRISFTVPSSFFAIDLKRMARAMLITWSRVMLPLCLIFLVFFLSRGGSFNSLKIKAEAVGTMVGVAYRAATISMTNQLQGETYNTIDDTQLHHDPDTLPLHSSFLDILTNLLG
jgi:hypothetical protein